MVGRQHETVDLEMIELRTGVIGSGKTLHAVAELAALQKTWAKDKEKWRPVYTFGVRNLALEHMELPAYPAGGKPGDPVEFDALGQPKTEVIPQWDKVEPGSLVIIDECHRMFAPGASGSKPPPHVAFLDMSRQAGIDVWLITQHPRKLHLYARSAVNRHLNFRRVGSGNRAVVYEYDTCNETLNPKQAITTRLFNYPRQAFRWYTSADAHTKLKFGLPAWLIVPVVGILAGLYFVPTAGGTLFDAMRGRGLGQQKQETAAGAGGAGTAASGSAPAGPADPAASPGVASGASAPSDQMPAIVGCIDGPRGGYCVDSTGRRVDLPRDVVAYNARHYGGLIPLRLSGQSGVVVSGGAHVVDPAPDQQPGQRQVEQPVGGLSSADGET